MKRERSRRGVGRPLVILASALILTPAWGWAQNVTVVTDFGARPGAEPSRNRAGIQAAIDAASKRGGVVRVPAGEYAVDGPIFLDREHTGLIGSGMSVSTIAAVGPYTGPVLLVGLPREPQGVKLDPANFYHLGSILDRSAGKRYGLRFTGGRHAAFCGTELDLGRIGKWWSGVRQLCVEFAVLGKDKGTLPDSPILGLADGLEPSPWIIQASNGRFFVSFKTDDGKVRGFHFAQAQDGTKLQRVAFQVDLEGRRVAAYLDGRQVVAELGETAFDGARPPVKLRANEFAPFKLNGSGGFATLGNEAYAGRVSDRLYCGLRVSDARRYAIGRPGSRQTRLDGKPLDDDSAYFSPTNETLGLLPLNEPGESAAPLRRVALWQRATMGCGFFLEPQHYGQGGWVAEPTLQELTIKGAIAVQLAAPLHMDILRVHAAGTVQGIGSFTGLVNYPIRIRDCRVSGDDVGLALDNAMADVTDLTHMRLGRHGVRCRRSLVSLRNAFAAGFGTCESYARLRMGWHTLENLQVDTEDGISPTVAAIDCEAVSNADMPNRLRIRTLVLGKLGKGAALIRLRGADEGNIRAEDLFAAGTEYRTQVLVEGPKWIGTIDLDGLRVGPKAIIEAGPGMASGLILRSARR